MNDTFMKSFFIICPVCGKTVHKSPDSIYKIKVNGRLKECCSWTCYRKYKDSVEANKCQQKF